MATVKDVLDLNGEIPDDQLLGRLVMFTITDESVRAEDMKDWFDDLSLDQKMLPPQIKPIDAFRKATAETTDRYVHPEGGTCAVMCRDVATKDSQVHRQITREFKDAPQTELRYVRAIDCVFYKASVVRDPATGKRLLNPGGERIRITIAKDIDMSERPFIEAIAKGIAERYNRYWQFLDGNRLRGTVRDYLKTLDAVEIKGGVYFVPSEHSQELRALQQLVSRFGGGCVMHTIPLVDVASGRDMVTFHYEQEAVRNLDSLRREMQQYRDTGVKMTPGLLGRLQSRLNDQLAKSKAYESRFNLSAAATTALVEAASGLLVDLAAGDTKKEVV